MRDEDFRPSLPARLNLAAYLLDARVDEGRGAAPALLTPDETLTYAQVQARTNRVAGALAAAGIVRGDRALLALSDGPDFVATLFGILKLGAVGAMANPDLRDAELEHLLACTGAKVVVTTSAVAWRAAGVIAASGATCLVVGPESGAGFRSLAAVSAGLPEVFRTVDTAADDEALWLFTSGSTGKPRAAVHRHRDFAYHIECYAKRILGLGRQDTMLSVPKLYFPYATGMSLLFPFAVGARTILFPEHPTPERLFDLIERFAPTILTTVPTMTAKMLAHPGATQRDLASVRLAVTAGEALPPDLHRRWDETFGVPMLDGIGSAEMFHIYISNRPGDVRPASLGRVVPGYEARVMRADGSPASDGEVGTLWVRGGSTFDRYHGDPEATAAALRDGWVVSGDMMRREGDQFFYAGRTDDMLKVAGIYVSPIEVEGVLARHPAVAECAVVGFNDEQGLVKPRAFVVLRPGHTADETFFHDLGQWARAELAHYKVPRSWVARDALPRNDRGKIVRRALRAVVPGVDGGGRGSYS